MASRFTVFHRPLMVHPKNVTLVIKGAVGLHNFLRNEVGVRYVGESTADYEDATGTLHPGDWRKEVSTNQLHSMRPAGVRGSNDATRIRDQFKNYFSSEIGSVSWQNARVTATHWHRTAPGNCKTLLCSVLKKLQWRQLERTVKRNWKERTVKGRWNGR